MFSIELKYDTNTPDVGYYRVEFWAGNPMVRVSGKTFSYDELADDEYDRATAWDLAHEYAQGLADGFQHASRALDISNRWQQSFNREFRKFARKAS